MTYTLLRFAHVIGVTLMGAGLIGVWIADLRSRQVQDLVRFAEAVRSIAVFYDGVVVPGAVILFVFGWMGLARLVRGEVKSLREREFVQAARAIGVPTRQVLFREILPNLVGPIIVSASIAVPAYITYEATLSYLGAGLVEPTASWGRTIADAQNLFATYPLWLWPSVIGLSLLVLALSLLGDSIRDAFDPTSRR